MAGWPGEYSFLFFLKRRNVASVNVYFVQQACMPAVNLALEDVNREKNLLPGFILKLHSNDSEVREMFVEKFEKHRREITMKQLR